MDRLNRQLRLASAFLVLALLGARPACADEQSASSDYLDAVRQELTRLNLSFSCNAASSTCSVSRDSTRVERRSPLVIQCDSETATIYLYLDRFLVLPADRLPDQLARRLLELNGRLVTGKFEWHPGQKTVRLSTILNTDTNFDRRAFRSQVMGLFRVADQLFDELRRLLEDTESPGGAESPAGPATFGPPAS